MQTKNFSLGIVSSSKELTAFLEEALLETLALQSFQDTPSLHKAFLDNEIMATLVYIKDTLALTTWDTEHDLTLPLSLHHLHTLLSPFYQMPYSLFSGFALYDTMLKGKEGRITLLRSKEAALLRCLLDSPEHTATRSTLLHDVWRYDETIDTHTLETHIYQLRQKLEEDPNAPKLLCHSENGYMLSCS